jgi:hypothetical protein
MDGAHVLAREEATRSEGANRKEKCISVRVPMTRGLDRSVREVASCREEWASVGELGRTLGED